jgi:predicted AlkP superfamily phosphohydrolase/phosphomutase
MTARRRLVMIGLDSADPALTFDRFAADMPVLTRLRADAAWGSLRSVVPPITVPAWACMMSGQTPGDLGVYGFRNRRAYDYSSLGFATSRDIRAPRIWDLLSAAGRDSVVVGLPGTYPPTPVTGCMVSCFMAPSTDAGFTHPPELAAELRELTGGYRLDVENFRAPDLGRIGQDIFDMTEQRFTVARHLMRQRDWDFLSFVDMGPDRLHHGFWKYCDPQHPRYTPGNEHEYVFRDYYRALDRHLADLLAEVPDDAAVMVVSDHGAQPMLGGFCINEWLRGQGLLTLNSEPVGPTPMAKADVDWAHTVAWAEGGYYGRLYLNVAGREPDGVVAPERREAVLDEIAAALTALPGPDGEPLGTRVMRPEEVYPRVTGFPPDLLVYAGNLRYRSLATLGLGQGLFTEDNDTGPDHANHAENGIVLLHGMGLDPGRLDDVSIYDVAPTLHEYLGLGEQPDQRGRPIR